MFGGMPTYQISSPQNSNLIRKYVEPIMQLFLKAPISWFFVAAFCFFMSSCLVMDVNRWVAVVGGLAFALSTNNMILFAEGHTSKFRALSYLPLALAGVYLDIRQTEIPKRGSAVLARDEFKYRGKPLPNDILLRNWYVVFYGGLLCFCS